MTAKDWTWTPEMVALFNSLTPDGVRALRTLDEDVSKLRNDRDGLRLCIADMRRDIQEYEALLTTMFSATQELVLHLRTAPETAGSLRPILEVVPHEGNLAWQSINKLVVELAKVRARMVS